MRRWFLLFGCSCVGVVVVGVGVDVGVGFWLLASDFWLLASGVVLSMCVICMNDVQPVIARPMNQNGITRHGME